MKNNLILITLILLSITGLQAQEESKWSLRASVGMTNAIITRNISPTSNLFSSQIGGSIAYQLNDRWDIAAGITYSQRGYKQNGEAIWGRDNGIRDRVSGPGTTFFPDPIIGCPLPTPPAGASLDGNNHKLHLLEVPISARFYLTKEKLKIFLSPGLTYYLPVSYSAKTQFILEDGSFQTEKNQMFFPPLRSVPLMGTFAVGAKFPIGDRLQIFGQSGLDYYVNTWRDQAVTIGWNWDVKTKVGVEMNF